MNAGKLRDLVQFQRRVLTLVNEQQIESWVNDFQEWTEATRISETACRFRMRYRTKSDGTEINGASHRIIWDGAYWNIASAPHDAKRSEILIECDFSMMLEVTHMQSTEREFIEGLAVIQPRVE